MGTWAHRPWDNDAAADWFGDLFDQTNLAAKVVEGLKLDVSNHADEVRAAAAMLIMLGRTYIWPIDRLDQDLALAIERLEKVASLSEFAEAPDLLKTIHAEIAELRARLNPHSRATEKTPWFW